jgi:flagellar FliL protein
VAAKKTAAAEEDGEPKKKGKKPILMVVIGLVAAFGAKTFLMKPAAKTPAQLALVQQQHDRDIYNACADANGKTPLADTAIAPLLPGETTVPAPPAAPAPTVPATTAPATQTTKGALGPHTRAIETQLIAASAAGAAPAPIVEGMGPVLALDSVTVNLADGHYLKLGLALQLAEGVDETEAKDSSLGSKALDLALDTLSKHSMSELTKPATRDELKSDLGFDVCRQYDDKVTTVYFTEFVMQ